MLYKVKDKSMQPNFKEGDFIIVNRLAYIFKKPSIGDVVVVNRSNKIILKRITSVSNEKYFVVGDNKIASKDSRSFGTIDKDSIIGKVMFHIKRV